MFVDVAQRLDRVGIADLHLIEPRIVGNIEDDSKSREPVAARLIRRHFRGTLIAAGGFKRDSAEAILQAGDAELVAFGRDVIANPDLPERLRRDLPLNADDRPRFFGGNEARLRRLSVPSRVRSRVNGGASGDA